MEVKLMLCLGLVVFMSLLSCENGTNVNPDEEFVNNDGLLDSIHGEIRTVGGGSYPLIFKFTYDNLQRPTKISYTSSYFDYYQYEMTLTYPNDSEILVKYQNHDFDTDGTLTIFHTNYEIDSTFRKDRGYNSPYPNISSSFLYNSNEIVQIDSIAFTRDRDSSSYTFAYDTIYWDLNTEGSIIEKSGSNLPFVYDDKLNVVGGSFFQVFWWNKHLPNISVRTLMPIIPSNNIVPDSAEYVYNAEGLLVKIKVLEIPQYELYYSY